MERTSPPLAAIRLTAANSVVGEYLRDSGDDFDLGEIVEAANGKVTS